MKIGTTIRAHRLQKGLSQGDIEKKTGLLRCYLSRVENGHTVPSLDTLSKIALALDLPIAQFFADDSLGHQFNTAEALRRGTALPHPDPPLLLKPERERPQAAAGHGQEVRRHGDPLIAHARAIPALNVVTQVEDRLHPCPPLSRACSSCASSGL